MRRLAMTLLLFALLAACESRKEQNAADAETKATDVAGQVRDAHPDVGPEIVYEEGPKPTPDTVLAKAGDVEVTMADFDRSVRVGRLFAPRTKNGKIPEVPKTRLALPHLHITMTRRLLERKLLMTEIERRGIDITREDVETYIRDDDKLSRWADFLDNQKKLKTALQRIGLAPDDLYRVARQQIARQRLEDALIEDISEEEIWERWQHENNTVELLLASTSNVPTTKELDAFVADNPDRIRRYFEEHPKEFLQPTVVKLHVVRPKPGEDISREKLAQAAKRLGNGEDPEKIAKALGLKAKENELLVKGENRRAFAADDGTSGFEMQGPRGAYAWVVVGHESSKKPELDRPMKREVAATILRREKLLPKVRGRLENALKLFRKFEVRPGRELEESKLETLKEAVEALGLTFHATEALPRTENGFIPGVGLARPVVEKAFEDLSKKHPVANEPILTREKGYAIALAGRTRPSRKEFEAKKSDIRERYTEGARRRIVDNYLAAYVRELDPSFDVRPLRVKYGVLQKK